MIVVANSQNKKKNYAEKNSQTKILYVEGWQKVKKVNMKIATKTATTLHHRIFVSPEIFLAIVHFLWEQTESNKNKNMNNKQK